MDTPLHQLAVAQGGILLTAQAMKLGWSWRDFHCLVTEENWCRLFRAAYLLPGTDDTPLARARAVQLKRPYVVASHQLAASIHGFAMVHLPRLEFTGVDKSRLDIPGGHLFRWALPPGDIEEVDGIRVTSPLRTCVDLLRMRDRDTAVIAIDSALRRGVVTLAAIADRLEHLAGDPGIRNAWKAFPCLDPKSDSPTESKTRLIMWDLKIYPATQVRIVDADGVTRYVDFLVDGVVFEPEGAAYHAGEDAHEADTRRFNALAIAARSRGYDFVRLTYRSVFTERVHTEAVILRTLAARRRRRRATP